MKVKDIVNLFYSKKNIMNNFYNKTLVEEFNLIN